MGIENRGYMTDDAAYDRSRGSRPGRWTMVTILIVMNVVVFILQTLNWRTALLEQWLALDLYDVLHGQIWRLTTYDFLHSTDEGLPLHLLFNMWLLYLTGRRVEDKLGSNEFLAFYLVAGILSGVGFLLWGVITQTAGVAIGASGAAVAVLIVYALNWPSERWYIYGILPMPVGVLALIAAALDIMPMAQQLLQGHQNKSHVAHAAHVGGMLFGLLYARFGWRITSFLGNWSNLPRRPRGASRPPLRVHVPDAEPEPVAQKIPPDVEARLDALLEKISQQGEATLTDEERHFLTETSRRYRERH